MELKKYLRFNIDNNYEVPIFNSKKTEDNVITNNFIKKS